MYYYPESGKDYKENVDEKVLAELEKEVAEYDLDEYLPASNLILYERFLQENGYPAEFTYNDPSHREAYLYLRDRVSQFIADSGEVELTLRPSGAADWIAANKNHEIEIHRGGVTGISGDTMVQLIPTRSEEHTSELQSPC